MEYVNDRNSALLLASKLSTSKDADYAKGSKIGVLYGSAIISGGYLNCVGNVGAYEDFDGNLNANAPQTGCIRIKYKPNYTGSPTDAINKNIICVEKATSDLTNRIELMHSPDGNIYWGATEAFPLYPLGAWSAVADQEYVFELDYDFTTGATRLFIDGIQLGATDVSTGIRTNEVGVIRIGANWETADTSDGSFKDLCIFNAVQHTANHNAEYTVGVEFPIPDDLITLVKLYGYIYNSSLPVASIPVKVRPYQAGFPNPALTGSGIFHNYDWTSFGVTSYDGYFEGQLYLQPSTKYWEIKIGDQSYYTALTDVASVDIATLTLTKAIPT